MNIEFKNLSFIVENNKIRFLKLGSFFEKDRKEDIYQLSEVNIIGRSRVVNLGNKAIYSSESPLLNYVSHKINGNTLEIVQQDDLIEVKTVFTAYDNTETIRVYSEVKNISNREIVLDEVTPITFSCFGSKDIEYAKKLYFTEFYQAHHTECQPIKYSFFERGLISSTAQGQRKVLVNNIGSWSTKERLPQGIITDENKGSSLMFQIESNASWFYEIGDKFNKYYLNLGSANMNHCGWAKKLQPNQIYKTISIAFVTGESETKVIEEMFKYRKNIYKVNKNDEAMPIVFNEYMHLAWDDPFEERVRQFAPIIQKLGIEYYVIDCGWHAEEYAPNIYPHVGEWKECLRRFPSGIKGISQYLASLGLKLGLWIEPEIVGIENRKVIEELGEDAFATRYGQMVTNHGRVFLDFRCEKVRKYATENIRRMIEDYGASYIKMDYNQDIGIGTDKNSDSFGEGLEQMEEAYLSWAREIQDKYPDVIFESCSSGGLRMDYRTLSTFPVMSLSDQTDYKRCPYLVGNILSAVIPEQGSMWSYPVVYDQGGNFDWNQKWLEENITYERVAMNMINTFLLRMCLSSHLEHLSDENFTLVKEGIDYYNKLTPFRKEAMPFMPLGFTDFSKDTVAVGLKKENKVCLAVYNLNGDKHKEIDIRLNIESARIAYPSKSITQIRFNNSILTVDFNGGVEAVFLEIETRN